MIDLDQLYKIYRRHHSGQKNSQISLLGYDRKTIRKYLGILEGHCGKYGLNASYESFKQFFRKNFPIEQKQIIRIELEPGRELQVDDGKPVRSWTPA